MKEWIDQQAEGHQSNCHFLFFFMIKIICAGIFLWTKKFTPMSHVFVKWKKAPKKSLCEVIIYTQLLICLCSVLSLKDQMVIKDFVQVPGVDRKESPLLHQTNSYCFSIKRFMIPLDHAKRMNDTSFLSTQPSFKKSWEKR